MTSPVRQVEQAIVAQLGSVVRPYAGLTVESYGGQLDDELFEWIRRLPATWVTFGEISEVRRVSSRKFFVKADFEVLVAQRHLVENQVRLAATAAADVGVYELLEDNKLALVNQMLGLAIQPLAPGAVRAVMKGQFNREAIAVYAQKFSTQWLEEIPEAALAPDGTLITVGLNYLLKPGDDVADTSDVVTTSLP